MRNLKMEYKKIYEFLVWDNCNNNCSFCFQREAPRLFNHQKRAFILDEVINFIQSDRFIKGSHILVCGGEIFDKPQDNPQLNNFFSKIITLMLDNVIDLLYLNTNLIYKDLTGLNFLLQIIKDNNLFDRLKFTTSYDLEGRFRKEEDRDLMLSNLKWINNTYPDCKIVVNTILTKQVCEALINESYKLSTFMSEYKCWVNLIPYIVLDNKLTAKRSDIFKALKIVDNDCPGYLSKYVPNMSITQEKLLYMYKDNEFKFCSCDIDKCGHSINFKRYSDKGTCFCCDLIELFKGI